MKLFSSISLHDEFIWDTILWTHFYYSNQKFETSALSFFKLVFFFHGKIPFFFSPNTFDVSAAVAVEEI